MFTFFFSLFWVILAVLGGVTIFLSKRFEATRRRPRRVETLAQWRKRSLTAR